MIELKIDFDARGLVRELERVQRRQIPFAQALAVTRLGKRAKDAMTEEMKDKFDRPTPWTLRGMFSTLAKPANPVSVVGWKDRPYGKNRLSSAQMLAHQFSGGARQAKALEKWLRRAGLLSANEFVVPGAAARLDRYGNMSRGQVQQVMSQLRVGPDASAYKSDSARSRRNVRRAGAMFWSRGGHLPRGVWMRSGASVKPILVAVAAPSYVRRLDLPKVVAAVVDRFADQEFTAAMAQAMRTAR